MVVEHVVKHVVVLAREISRALYPLIVRTDTRQLNIVAPEPV